MRVLSHNTFHKNKVYILLIYIIMDIILDIIDITDINLQKCDNQRYSSRNN